MPKLIQKITTEIFPFQEPTINGFGGLVAEYGSGDYIEIGNVKMYLIDLSRANTITDIAPSSNYGFKAPSDYTEYKFSF